MTPDRQDHITAQYVWALENEYAFVQNAKHATRRGSFRTFCKLVIDSSFAIRKDLGEEKALSLTSVEWSFLHLELWYRMGGQSSGFIFPSDAEFYERHVSRLRSNCKGRSAPMPTTASRQQPCAEIEMEVSKFRAQAKEPSAQTDALINQLSQITLSGENTMSNKVTFQTITYINGSDVTKLSDEQLINAIKTIEAEIKDLTEVKTKSTKITAKIADAKATLAKVVEVLDGRE